MSECCHAVVTASAGFIIPRSASFKYFDGVGLAEMSGGSGGGGGANGGGNQGNGGNATSYHQHQQQQQQQQSQLEQAGLLSDLNGIDLAMSLSPKQHSSHVQTAGVHTTPFSVTDILSPIEESYRKLELAAAAAAVGVGVVTHPQGSPYGNACGARVGGNTGSSSASSGSPPLHGGSTPGGSTPGPVSLANGAAPGGGGGGGGSAGGTSGGMSAMGNPYATMQLTSQYQYCAAELSPYHHAGPGVGATATATDPMRSHAVSSHHHPWYAPAPPATNDPRFASE